MYKKKICVMGNGSWSTAIAKVIGTNVTRLESFDTTVNMWIYEEMVEGKKLTDIINTTHENKKYFPTKILPTNVVAISDAVEATKKVDILVFAVPPHIVPILCSLIRGRLKANAVGISLVKGFNTAADGTIDLVSDIIRKQLKIKIAVLMGANLAHEIADGKFSETTIACHDKKVGNLFKRLLETDYIRISVIKDVKCAELCGALKDIVAIGAGFVDGLKLGRNAKTTIIRLGFIDMIKFVDEFYPDSHISTIYESCGIADLTLTCHFDRNRKVAEISAASGKSIRAVESELLGDQQIQGPITAASVNFMLTNKKELDISNIFPIFTTVHKICSGELLPKDLIETIKLNRNKKYIVKNMTQVPQSRRS